MALTFAQARTILQSRIADSSDDTTVDQAINQAQREVGRARRWPELVARKFFTTSAVYDTGTAAVTNGSKTVTLTGGVWPTDVATGTYRFALGMAAPWYEVETRTSDTVIVLKDAYVDDTDSAAAYAVYKSHYTLDDEVDRVEQLFLHDAGHVVELAYAGTDGHLSEFIHYPSGPGVPTHFYNMERTSLGKRQILVGPNTPNDVYRVEYVYKKKTTDDALSLDEVRWPVVLSRASAILYEPEEYERSLAEMRKYKILLADAWSDEGETETEHVRVGQTRVEYPETSRTGYLDRLLGFGRVEDPS